MDLNNVPKKRGRPFSKPKEVPEVSTAPKSELIKPKPKEVPKVPKEQKETKHGTKEKSVDNSLAGKIKEVEKVSMQNKKQLDAMSKKLDAMLKKIR